MTGMDMLLASLTQEQLVERSHLDVADAMADLERAVADLEAEFMRWLIEDLEKRIRE